MSKGEPSVEAVAVDPDRPGPGEVPLIRVLADGVGYLSDRGYDGSVSPFCDRPTPPPPSARIGSAAARYLPWRVVAPIAGHERGRSPRTLAAAADACLTFRQLRWTVDYGDPSDDREATILELVNGLVDADVPGYEGFCVGHPGGGGRDREPEPKPKPEPESEPGPGPEPDLASTARAVRTLLRAGSLDREYLSVARSAAAFVTDECWYWTVDRGAKVRPRPDARPKFRPGTSAVGARLLLDLHAEFGDTGYRTRAEALLDPVVECWRRLDDPVGRETPGWQLTRTYPAGLTIEALLRHREVVGAGRYDEVLREVVPTFRRRFVASGGERQNQTDVCRDLRVGTQAVRTFTETGDHAAAEGVLRRVIDRLRTDDGGVRAWTGAFEGPVLLDSHAEFCSVLATYLSQVILRETDSNWAATV
jgi:hypothetical protein